MNSEDKVSSGYGKKTSPYETARFWVIQYILLTLSGIFSVSVFAYCIQEILLYPDVSLLYILAALSFLSMISCMRFLSSLLHFTKLLRRNRFLEYTHEGAMSVSSITEYVKQENKKNQDFDDFLSSIRQTTKRSATAIMQMSDELTDSKNVIKNMQSQLGELAETLRKERERNIRLMAEKETIPVNSKDSAPVLNKARDTWNEKPEADGGDKDYTDSKTDESASSVTSETDQDEETAERYDHFFDEAVMPSGDDEESGQEKETEEEPLEMGNSDSAAAEEEEENNDADDVSEFTDNTAF